MTASGGNFNFNIIIACFCDTKGRKDRPILSREASTLIDYEGESILPKFISKDFCQWPCALKGFQE